MTYTFSYRGGLGDFFRFMAQPMFERYHIRMIPKLLQEGHTVILHIYSDNPDSANIWLPHPNLTVYRHKFSEDMGACSPIDIPEAQLPVFGNSYIPNTRKSDHAVIHPFTTTECKMWGQLHNAQNALRDMIDILIDKYNVQVTLLGKDTPEVYFGKKESWRIQETFNYERPGLCNYVNKEFDTPYVHVGYRSILSAKYLFCVDSAYMMARWFNPSMRVFSLFPDQYSRRGEKELFADEYYQGLDNPMHGHVYYGDLDVARDVSYFMDRGL